MHRVTWVLGIILGVIVSALTLTTALAEEEPPVVGESTAATSTGEEQIGEARGGADSRASDDRFGLNDLVDLDSLVGVAIGDGGTDGDEGALPALDERLGLAVDTLVRLEPGVQELVNIGREVDNLRGVSVGELIGITQGTEDRLDLGSLGELSDRLHLDNLVKLGTPVTPVTPVQTPDAPIDVSGDPQLNDVVNLRDLAGANDTVVTSESVVAETPADVGTDDSLELTNLIGDQGVEGELVDVANLVSLTQPVTVPGAAGDASTEASDSSGTTAPVAPVDGDPGAIGAAGNGPAVAGDVLGLGPRLGAVAGTTPRVGAPLLTGRIHLGDLVELGDLVNPADGDPVEGARLDPNGGTEALALGDGGPTGGAGVIDLDALLDDGDGQIAGHTDAGDLLRGDDDDDGGRRLVLDNLLDLSDDAPPGG